MSAATAERSAPVKVAEKEKVYTFFARRKDLRLVIKAEYHDKDGQGQTIRTHLGQRLAFDEGRLRVPAKGQMRGEKGMVLDSQEVLRFLLGDEDSGRLAHPLLGDKFDGFWLHEEAAPQPTEAERELLAELAMEFDVEGIEGFIRAEMENWKREGLVAEARKALDRARTKRTEQADAIKAAEAKGAAEAKAAAKPAGK